MKIELGKILKPQGIKGELKVLPISLPEYLKSVELVEVDGKEAKILSCSLRDGFAYVMLDICKDRDTAETLRDKIIKADKDDLPDLADGQFFYEDLIGCKVYFEDGEFVGEIVDIENYGSADIFVIKNGLNIINCPYVGEVFKDIDTKLKRITANKKDFEGVTKYED